MNDIADIFAGRSDSQWTSDLDLVDQSVGDPSDLDGEGGH